MAEGCVVPLESSFESHAIMLLMLLPAHFPAKLTVGTFKQMATKLNQMSFLLVFMLSPSLKWRVADAVRGSAAATLSAAGPNWSWAPLKCRLKLLEGAFRCTSQMDEKDRLASLLVVDLQIDYRSL